MLVLDVVVEARDHVDLLVDVARRVHERPGLQDLDLGHELLQLGELLLVLRVREDAVVRLEPLLEHLSADVTWRGTAWHGMTRHGIA